MVEKEKTIPPMRILFIVSFQFNPIGGHLLSAITLGKYLQQRGHSVGLLVHPTPVPELANAGIQIHHSPYHSGLRGFFRRTLDTYHVTHRYEYEVLVAMDWCATWRAVPTAWRFGLPLLQVYAGGPMPALSPLHLPGIIVFSEELYDGLQKQHGLPAEDLVLSPGRVDFDWFQEMARTAIGPHSLGFASSSPRLLAISRLVGTKTSALLALLEQVEVVAQRRAVQLRVVGEGEDRTILEQRAEDIRQATGGKADIRFMGGFRVQASDLIQADLVIGQGRTVLEAIACGKAAAVCGSNGYNGLLCPENFSALVQTNLTGREFRAKTTLAFDLQRLERYYSTEFTHVRGLVSDRYGAQRGAEAVEQAITLFRQGYRSRGALRRDLPRLYLQAALGRLEYYIQRRLKARLQSTASAST